MHKQLRRLEARNHGAVMMAGNAAVAAAGRSAVKTAVKMAFKVAVMPAVNMASDQGRVGAGEHCRHGRNWACTSSCTAWGPGNM